LKAADDENLLKRFKEDVTKHGLLLNQREDGLEHPDTDSPKESQSSGEKRKMIEDNQDKLVLANKRRTDCDNRLRVSYDATTQEGVGDQVEIDKLS